MHSTAHDSIQGHASRSRPISRPGNRPSSRPRIGTIVILILLTAAVAEPVVMYVKLAHQKEQRRQAAELALPVKVEVTAEGAPAIQ